MKHNIERGNVRLRFLDRYVGIPVVMALGLIRHKSHKNIHKQINTLAFLHTAAIGDTILLSASVKDVKDAYPNANLTLFAGSSNYEMAQLVTGIDRIIKLPVNNPVESIKLIRESGIFDVWIDFGPWPRLNAILSYFAKAHLKIGFKTKGQYRHYAYDVSVAHSDKIHELYNYRKILNSLNIQCNNLPSIFVESSAASTNKIVIHMFPGGYKSYLKEWPEHKWVEIIDILNHGGYYIFLTGAKADHQKAVNIRNKVHNKEQVNVVAGKLDLKQTAQLLQSSKLVISVNTGIMHLAAALGCNLVALHGPTSVKRWGPLSANAISIKSSLPCSPCLNLGFEYVCNKNTCMIDISAEAVINKVRKMLI